VSDEAREAAPTPGLRRTPRQRRSREIVAAILEAARQILAEREIGALTTQQVADRAGISIGSLYRYFPDKEAVIAALQQVDTRAEARSLAESDWAIDALPLREALEVMVDFQLDRHRRLLDRYGRFHRERHRLASLAGTLGPVEVEGRIRCFLERRSDSLRAIDLDHAAFFLSRGMSALIRKAVEERPHKLAQPSFRAALVEIAARYLLDEPEPRLPDRS